MMPNLRSSNQLWYHEILILDEQILCTYWICEIPVGSMIKTTVHDLEVQHRCHGNLVSNQSSNNSNDSIMKVTTSKLTQPKLET